MIEAVSYFQSDIGVHALPDNLPDYPPRKDGQPDRRYRIGKEVAKFFEAERQRLLQAWADGDDHAPNSPLSRFPPVDSAQGA